jgi:hypothetical protein
MKFATWNLERVRPGVGVRSERIRGAIASVDADVWILTETHSRFELPDPFVGVAASAPAVDRKDGEQWVSIWARRELGAQPLAVTGEPGRSAALLIPRSRGDALLVFGTVLPWRGDRTTPLRGADRFIAALAAQAADWRRLAAGHQAGSVCVAGDFNQELSANGPVGTGHGRAALRETLEDGGLTCVTADAGDPLLARKWRASIDHVALSTSRSNGARVSAVWPDHFPLGTSWPDHHGVCVDAPDA